MIDLAEKANHPFQKYFCYWAAFNNIYTLIGQQQGISALQVRYRNGLPKTEQNWTYIFPKVNPPSERQLILNASSQLDGQSQVHLIRHPNVEFFVNRTPIGASSKQDNRGQVINGVLNITRTINPKDPIWSPINEQAYLDYLAGTMSHQAVLTEQIVFLLYTVRNNLVHGSKKADESSDIEIVENALPLLELVTYTFIQ